MKIVVEHCIKNEAGDWDVAYYDAHNKTEEGSETVIPTAELEYFFEWGEYGHGFEDKFSYTKGHYTEDWNCTFEQYMEDWESRNYLAAEYLQENLNK